MSSLPKFEKTSVILNRFCVKELSSTDCTVYEYNCRFQQNPEPGNEYRAIASICYKIGVSGVRLGNKIITKELINSNRLKNNEWELTPIGEKPLNCANSAERKALESLERRELEKKIKQKGKNKTAIQRASEGGLILWKTGAEGKEKCGEGWEVHRGRRIDIVIDSDSVLYLEIDVHHRFYTPWTLHQ